jgi:hypothetical protein
MVHKDFEIFLQLFIRHSFKCFKFYKIMLDFFFTI